MTKIGRKNLKKNSKINLEWRDYDRSIFTKGFNGHKGS